MALSTTYYTEPLVIKIYDDIPAPYSTIQHFRDNPERFAGFIGQLMGDLDQLSTGFVASINDLDEIIIEV